MGFWDRAKDVVGGLGGAVQAPLGLGWDLVRAPMTDDGHSGILGTLNAVALNRFGQFAERGFGPESGLGAAVGGLPEGSMTNPLNWPRSGGGPVVGGGLEGLETAGEYGIRRPATTLMTAAQLAESEEYQGEDIDLWSPEHVLTGWTNFMDRELWSDAWEISDARSPGQAVALTFGTKDILNEDEVERFAGTDWYQTASGIVDIAFRLRLEPDFLAFKGGQAYRQGVRGAQGRLAPGTVFQKAPPQIGSRAGRHLPTEARPLQAINNRIDRAYSRMPGPVRNALMNEQVLGPADSSRLARLEETRFELGLTDAQRRTADLRRRAETATDPAEAATLQNILTQRETREARVGAGAVPIEALEGSPQRRMAAQAETDIDRYFGGRLPRRGEAGEMVGGEAWTKVDQFIENMPTDVDTRAGIIRDRLFPTHHRGDILSRFLAEAQGPAERQAVMRVGLGDMRALKDLERSNYALGARLRDRTFEQSTIRSQPMMTLVPPEPMRQLRDGQLSLLDAPGLAEDHVDNLVRLRDIGKEIDAIRTQGQRNEFLLQASKSVPTPPAITVGTRGRNAVKSSALWQDSFWSKPVRTVFDMRPHHIVNGHDTQADAQLGRFLNEAGYGAEEIARARGQFMEVHPDQRGTALSTWIGRAEQRVLSEAGLDADEIDLVLREANLRRGEANGLLRSTKYDGEGRARVQLPGSDEMLEMPLWVSQLENLTTVPNFRRLRREADRYARLKHGDGFRAGLTRKGRPGYRAAKHGQEGLRSLMDVWKTSVLLRPAWTFRVVGDEQLRMIAKFGALSVALGERQNLHNYMARLKTNPMVRRVLRTDDVSKGGRRGGLLGAAAGIGMAGPMGAIAGGTLGNRLVRKTAQAEMQGYANLRVGGQSISGAFGTPGSKAEVYRTLAGTRAAADDVFGLQENRIFGALKRDEGQWRTHRWGDSDQANHTYRTEWARQVRTQLSQDEMARQFLAGKSPDDVLDWMDNTLEGRAYAAKVPYRWDHQAWVEAAADQVNSYTGGSAEVRQAILETSDKASAKTWEKILDQIPEDSRMPIHGAELSQVTARGPIQGAITEFVNNSFDILGDAASDELSRIPTFQMFYNAEMRRLSGDAVPGRVHASQMERWESSARDFALRETRELLYDLAERSQFGEMVRTLIPFYSAWQEVLTRWTGLVAENPTIFPRAREIWRAPEKAGWTHTDDEGNTFIRFKIPEFARGLVDQGLLPGALDSQGYIAFDQSGFNLAAEGLPGAGPIVQVAASEAVKRNPGLEESVEFILPWGPVDTMDAFLPSVVSRAMASQRGDESAARLNAQGRLIQTALVEMQNGDRPMVDLSDPVAAEEFLEDIDDELDSFMKLRTFTGFVAPVAPIYESPYQPYIEVYRALRDGNYPRANELATEYGLPIEGLPDPEATADPFAADDIFLETFGEEYYALTQRFSESLNGVPPTLEGLETSEDYGDLITRHPEWGSVIAGYDGGGEAMKFSRAIYDRQLESGERRRLDPEEILEGPDVRLGWTKYSKAMDLIELNRVQLGLPNLQVAEAEGLRAAKDLAVTRISQEHPAWFAKFSQTDRLAMDRRIEGAREMVAHPSLAGRPDIQGLAEYLTLRDTFSAWLTTRSQIGEPASLDAVANTGPANLWHSEVADLLDRNPEFADLWYRKLERDVPDASASI